MEMELTPIEITDSRQRDTRIENRKARHYGMQIDQIFEITRVVKPEDFKVYHSEISLFRNIQEELTRRFADVVFPTNWVVSANIYWRCTDQNFIIVSFTLSVDKPSKIPASVMSISPNMDNVRKTVLDAIRAAEARFASSIDTWRADQDAAQLLDWAHKLVSQRAKESVNYAARLKALQEEVKTEYMRLAQDHNWENELDSITDSGTSEHVRRQVLKDVTPYLKNRDVELVDKPFAAYKMFQAGRLPASTGVKHTEIIEAGPK